MSINVKLDIFPFTNQGKRQYQEDYLYTDPVREGRPWLGIVSDGMGGHQGGDVASQSGVHAIYRAFDAAISARQPIKEALDSSVTKGHQAVLKAAEKVNAVGDMGATIAAFVIDGTKLYWCSAGDSRIYLIRQGRIKQLSRDHNLAEDMREGLNKGEWTLEDIQNNPQKNALTSFMGSDNWRMDSRSTVLQSGDIIVACSDGVYGTIGDEGIAEACRNQIDSSAKVIADGILKRVLDIGKANQDNCTAIVVCCEGASVENATSAKTSKSKAIWYAVAGVALIILLIVSWVLRDHISSLIRNEGNAAVVSVPTAKGTKETIKRGPDIGERLNEIEKNLKESPEKMEYYRGQLDEMKRSIDAGDHALDQYKKADYLGRIDILLKETDHSKERLTTPEVGDGKPKPGEQDKPIPAKQDKPIPAKQDKPIPAKQDKPIPAKQDKPIPAKQDKPIPAKQDKPIPAKQDKPIPAKQDKPIPAKQDKPIPAKQDKPIPAKQDKPIPAKQDKPELDESAKSERGPATETGSNANVTTGNELGSQDKK